jgi:penicillin-binding protein 1C
LKKAFFLLFFLLCAGFFTYKWFQVPDKALLSWHTYSRLYLDTNHKPLHLSLSADEKYRLWVDYEDISPDVIKATLLYEDKYFYSHPGVNFPALFRAFMSTYITKERRVGASTITMQVARAAFNLRSRTLSGKIKQIFYALWLEQHYSKEEILTYYFNAVSYGANIEGIEAASQIYFHKSAVELSTVQALSLVVIPQNPSKRNPLRQRGYQEMLTARARLFDIYKEELPSEEQKSLSTWMHLPLKVHQRHEFPFLAPHFTSYLNATHPNHYGTIHTTLDLSTQKLVEDELSNWVNKQRALGISNAAALLIEKKSMKVRAWVGSENFYDDAILGQVDGVSAKRSPGSTLKPFAYALAMEQGLIHPASLLKDTPYKLQAYTPENYDRVFLGPITATQALITSRNIPAVRLASQLKEPSFYNFLQKSGITEMKASSHYGISIVLGGMEVSLLELATLYGVLANKGRLKPLQLHENEDGVDGKKMLSPESAYLTLDMLRQTPELKTSGYSAPTHTRYAWKTGTSFAFRDALTAGIGDEHILVIWVGNFDGSANPSFIGRQAAAPLFFNVFKALNENDVFTSDIAPSTLNLAKVDICKTTGKLPSKLCPSVTKGWFIPGVSPIDVANVYREVPINTETGKRACREITGQTHMEVFEFWPSDIREMFMIAGIHKRQPPEYEQSCALSKKRSSAPRIQSPTKGLIYTMPSDKIEESLIPFTAILDADSHQAFWYLNKSFVGKSNSNTPLFWKPQLGEFTLKVVDEKGLSSSQQLIVELAH